MDRTHTRPMWNTEDCIVIRSYHVPDLQHGEAELPIPAATKRALVLATKRFPRMLDTKSIKPSRNQVPGNERDARPHQSRTSEAQTG